MKLILSCLMTTSKAAFAPNLMLRRKKQRLPFIFSGTLCSPAVTEYADDFQNRPLWHLKWSLAQLFGHRSPHSAAAAILDDPTPTQYSKRRDSLSHSGFCYVDRITRIALLVTFLLLLREYPHHHSSIRYANTWKKRCHQIRKPYVHWLTFKYNGP